MISSHLDQHLIIAALSRQMNMFTYIVILTYSSDDFIWEIFGMGGGKSEADVRETFGCCGEEISETSAWM